MKFVNFFFLIFISFVVSSSYAQTKNGAKANNWIKVSEDETVTISYDSNIVTSKNGNHFVWVKAVYHSPEWQSYFTDMIGSRTTVVSTRTRAEYDGICSAVRVRRVICYSKAGKVLYDSGDDTSASWGYVNASDPVGIVGEYLNDKYTDR